MMSLHLKKFPQNGGASHGNLIYKIGVITYEFQMFSLMYLEVNRA